MGGDDTRSRTRVSSCRSTEPSERWTVRLGMDTWHGDASLADTSQFVGNLATAVLSAELPANPDGIGALCRYLDAELAKLTIQTTSA